MPKAPPAPSTSSREKVLRALRGDPLDTLPVYENFVSLDNARRLVPDVVTDEHEAILSSREPAAAKNARYDELLKRGLEQELKVIRKAGIDALSVAIHPEVRWISPDRLETEFGRIYTPNRNLLGYADMDELQQDPSGGWIDSTVSSIEDLVERDLRPAENRRLRFLEDFADGDVLVIPELLMLQRVWSIFGYLEWIDLMRRREELFQRVLDQWLAYNLTAVDILADAGFEVFFYGDDFGSSQGGLYPMKPFQDHIVPYLSQIVDAVHRRGGRLIFHSCGDVRAYLPALVDDVGIDGLHPLEPPMMDFGRTKREWGDRLCLVGNVDSRTTLVDGTPDEVRDETRRIVRTGRLDRHILAASHSIHPGVRFESWMAMLSAAREYGTRSWIESHPPRPEYEEEEGPLHVTSAAGLCPSCHLAPPSRELPADWDEAVELRRAGKIGPVDLFVVARDHEPPADELRGNVAIATVASPHETGRTIVAACLRAEGYRVTDVGTVLVDDFRQKLAGFDVVHLSCVKNPQAVEAVEEIGPALAEERPDVVVVVGGSAVNRLALDLQAEGATEDEAREVLRRRFEVDGLGLDEVDAIDLTRELVGEPRERGR